MSHIYLKVNIEDSFTPLEIDNLKHEIENLVGVIEVYPEVEIEDVDVICEFRGCTKNAEFDGWYRVLDFSGTPTGLVQKILVCSEHSKHLIGNQ